MQLQDWIHRITEGGGDRAMRLLTSLLCFVALSLAYDLRGYKSLSSQEAMDTAQLARNIAEGRGYTTLSVRPFDLALMRKAATNAPPILDQMMPDISNPPVYPALVALVFKVGAFRCGSGQSVAPWDLEPWIMGLNQALFFIAAMLLFKTAAQLFDKSVAWLASGVFVATDLMWQFSVSGLSTMLLLVIFLLIVRGLVRLDFRINVQLSERRSGVGVCLAIGAIIAIGGLTQYSFAWLLVPVLLFILLTVAEGRAKLCLAVSLAFLAVMTPWLARNYHLSGNLFGSAGYSVFQSTPGFPSDTLERSFDPRNGLSRINAGDFADKLLVNTRNIVSNDLPRLGGNWISAFFLVGLLVSFRKPILSKIRFFVLGSVVFLTAIQAMGQTHLTEENPMLNSENLLIVFAPMVFVFGAAFYFTLLEQLDTHSPAVRTALISVFFAVVCAPFILVFMTPPSFPPVAFDPYYIQRVVNWTGEDELMISDIPSAVAWYGYQTCAWLPLNSREEFDILNRIKPVRAIYLTQRTTANFMSQTSRNPASWERFALNCWTRGEVPDQFPLTKAPTGFLPDRVFLSATDRWRSSRK